MKSCSTKELPLHYPVPPTQGEREDLGNLSIGTVADIAVLSIRNGTFGFIDAGGNKIEGQRKLEAELTIRAGKIVWDLNGLSATLIHDR